MFGSNSDEGDALRVTSEGEVLFNSNIAENFDFILADNFRFRSYFIQIIEQATFLWEKQLCYDLVLSYVNYRDTVWTMFGSSIVEKVTVSVKFLSKIYF